MKPSYKDVVIAYNVDIDSNVDGVYSVGHGYRIGRLKITNIPDPTGPAVPPS